MDFADNQKMSTGKMVGIGIVILLHILLVYALVSGLATSAVNIITKPLAVKVIQAQLAPPPPPPQAPPPPPQLTAPPPPYIPPPLIQTQQPVTPPVFAVTSAVKPTAPQQVAPPPAAPAPSTSVSVACPNVGTIAGQLSDSFQQIAEDDGISSAKVVVQFSIDPTGRVSGAHVVSSSDPGVDSLALEGIAKLRCSGQGQTVQVTAPFAFQTN